MCGSNLALARGRDHPPCVASSFERPLIGPHRTVDGRLLAGALVAFAGVALLAFVDVMSDLRAGTTAGHVAIEVAVVMIGLAGAAVVGLQLRAAIRQARDARAEAQALSQRLAATAAEAARWRAEASDLLKGLGSALDRQFERWSLSPAEKEVALLLLKGLSHKEIAEVRTVAEATARQQARAVYRKAGLSGRNDLAAFFLEDLLLPAGGDRAG